MIIALLIGTHVLAFLVGGAVAWRVAHARGWSKGLRAGVNLGTSIDAAQARAFFGLPPV
jgi:hypothetical protein